MSRLPRPEHKRIPLFPDDYRSWLAREHQVDEALLEPPIYTTVSADLLSSWGKSKFWEDLCRELEIYDYEYQARYDYPLLCHSEFSGEFQNFSTGEVPPYESSSIFAAPLFAKSFDSFFLKTYRRNVLDNTKWPQGPLKGEGRHKLRWVLPENWFDETNDAIRTTLVVRQADGVEFLVERLRDLAKRLKLKFTAGPRALENGYYAWHFYVWHYVVLPDVFPGMRKKHNTRLEIQVTTRIQDEIRTVTHDKYNERRIKLGSWLRQEVVMFNGKPYHWFCLDPVEYGIASSFDGTAVEEGVQCPYCNNYINTPSWQWQLNSAEFDASYLGHILHYIEGRIVRARMDQIDRANGSGDETEQS